MLLLQFIDKASATNDWLNAVNQLCVSRPRPWPRPEATRPRWRKTKTTPAKTNNPRSRPQKSGLEAPRDQDCRTRPAMVSCKHSIENLSPRHTVFIEFHLRCHWRLLKMTLFDKPSMTYYWCSMMALCCRYTGYGFLLVFYRNFVPKTHRFWDI